MLIHFPTGLYPFSFVMDILCSLTGNPDYRVVGLYSLAGAVIMSVLSMVYGAIDFLQIDSKGKAWKTAGIHALLNISWLILFSSLLFYRIKYGHVTGGWIYLSMMGFGTAGLFFSNYLGADLVHKYRIGIDNTDEK